MKTSLCLMFVIVAITLFAARLDNQSFIFTQPDGSKLNLAYSGDEFEHRMHDAEGWTVLQDPESGFAVYAIPEGKGIKPSGFRVGTVDPTALGIAKNLLPDPSHRQSLITSKETLANSSQRTSSTGTIKNIVIFIRFLNQNEYTTPLSSYEAMCNSTVSESMHGYFLADSDNQLTVNATFCPNPVGGIVRSFQDGHNRGYFSPYNASTNPEGYGDEDTGRFRMHAMFRAAVNAVGSSVPSGLNVDGDGDGFVDNVIFVMQGDPDPVWGSMLWPQQWFLDFLPMGINTVYINNKIVCTYNIQLSNSLVNPVDFSTMGMGVLCHEFSHSIGFPDLYHYEEDNLDPVGPWELMGSQGTIPQPHFTYAKQKYAGWTGSITTITPTATPTTYTLAAINDSPFAAYRISSSMPNQFYLLEYRKQSAAYGSSLPGSGLIVYRITQYYEMGTIQFPLEGNSDGPPDEFYVYRPNGDIDLNGQLAQAHLSGAVGRSSLYNYTDTRPWLYNLNGQVSLDGNIQLTDINENADGTISFIVHGANLNIWRGDTDTNWNVASNWSLGTVPTASHWVEIPVTSHNYYPMVYEDSEAKHVTIKGGTGLSVGLAELHVSEDLNVFGLMATSSPQAVYIIEGNLDFRAGASTWFYWDGHFYVKGNLTFHPGSNIDMEGGVLEFYSTGSSNLIQKSAASVNNLKSSKPFPFALVISSQSTAELSIKGNLYIDDGCFISQFYTGNTLLHGSLLAYGNGAFTLSQGSLALVGDHASSLYGENSNAYLNHLIINKSGSGSVTLDSDLKVNNDLQILGGVLNASLYKLQLGGNYVCSLGTGAFNPGIATLSLFGSAVQSLSPIHVYRLELNKSGGFWSIPAGSSVQADYYNWTSGSYRVSGGSFSVSFLDDPGVFGEIFLSSGSINYHQASNAFIDLRGNLTITGGTFTLSGGSSIAYFSYIDAAALNMSGGVLDFSSQGIFVPDMFSFTENISGGTIRTVGNLIVERVDFTPSNNTIEFYGSADAEINLMNGSSLHNVICNKAALRQTEEPFVVSDRQGNRREISRSNTLICNSSLELNGSLSIINGNFNVNGQYLQISGNLGVESNLTMLNEGSLSIEGEVIWNGNAVVDSGTFSCFGNWTFGAGSSANLNGSLTTLTAYAGAQISIASATASFGHLELNSLGDNPVFAVSSSSGNSLKIANSLTVRGDNTLALGSVSCNVLTSCYIDYLGSLTLDTGSVLDVQGSLSLVGTLNIGQGYVSSHGFFNLPRSGALLINGGYFYNDAPWYERGTFSLYGALNITDGSFEIYDNSVSIYSHPTRVFNNAYLKMGRSFRAIDAGCYQPLSGTLYLEGQYGAEISLTAGNYLADLLINKDEEYAYVMLGQATTINGDLQLMSGYLDAGSYSHSVSGSASIGSTMYLGAGGSIAIAQNKNLNVTNGGYLYLSGNAEIPVTITRQGTSGYYNFNVLSGGTLAADYTVFEYVNGSGVYLHPGSQVDSYHSFTGCTFSQGVSGGSLLRLDNGQTFTVEGAVFPSNTWGGAANVSKYVNNGEVTFINYSGAFAGETFEQDSFNRITWNLNGILPVQSVSLFRSYDTGQLMLLWEYGGLADSFKVLYSDSPDGVYNLLETTTENIVAVPGNLAKAFFRVVAVRN